MDKLSALKSQLDTIETQLAEVRSFRYHSFEYADHLEQIIGRIKKEIENYELDKHLD